MKTEEILFSFLRCAICGEDLNKDAICACTTEELEAVYSLARKHDLAHLMAHALEKVTLPAPGIQQKLKKAKATAIYRYTQLDYEYGRICAILETGKIPFMPLKGAVLRQYYPEPWMRNSCDIDFLIKPENLWDAVNLLEQNGYQRREKSDHDISLYAPCGVHLELHFSLVKKRYKESIQEILGKIWEEATQIEDAESHYRMSDAMFYFCHMTHMAGHVLVGGCGIRFFLDTWILNHRMCGNRIKRENLLQKGNLLSFAKAAEKLSECWFMNVSQDEQTSRFAEYILRGGMYGIRKNMIEVQKVANIHEKTNYRRILIPYSELRYVFPVLDKKPWLMPVCQILRWFRFLGTLKRRIQKRLAMRKVADEAELEMQQMLQYLDL